MNKNNRIVILLILLMLAVLLVVAIGMAMNAGDGGDVTDGSSEDASDNTTEVAPPESGSEESSGGDSDTAGGDPTTDVTTGGETTEEATTEEATTEAPIPTETRFSFLAAGDVIIHECVYKEAQKLSGTGGYNFLPMYSEIADMIASAGLSFVNMEAPIAGFSVTGYPNFNAPPEAGKDLVSLGFDIVNMANNHMLDVDGKGTGLLNTVNFWKAQAVMMVGGYLDQNDYDTIRVVEKDGVKIAVLSYTYGTNRQTVNSASPNVIVPKFNEATAKRHIEEAKKVADLVFVSMHWGNENTFNTTSTQRSQAQLLADCGVDVIIGHHSHTVQPVEWLDGEDGNKTLCAYSLGNLIHTQINPKNIVGGILTFDIVKSPEGRVYVENPILTPTACHYLASATEMDSQDLYVRYDIKIYKLEDYTEALCTAHGMHTTDPTAPQSFTLATLKKYVTDTIKKEFLGSFS